MPDTTEPTLGRVAFEKYLKKSDWRNAPNAVQDGWHEVAAAVVAEHERRKGETVPEDVQKFVNELRASCNSLVGCIDIRRRAADMIERLAKPPLTRIDAGLARKHVTELRDAACCWIETDDAYKRLSAAAAWIASLLPPEKPQTPGERLWSAIRKQDEFWGEWSQMSTKDRLGLEAAAKELGITDAD